MATETRNKKKRGEREREKKRRSYWRGRTYTLRCFLYLSGYFSFCLLLHFLFKSNGDVSEKQERTWREKKHKYNLNDEGEQILWLCFLCLSAFFLSFSVFIFSSYPVVTQMRNKNKRWERKNTILMTRETEHFDFRFLFLSAFLSLLLLHFLCKSSCNVNGKQEKRRRETKQNTILMTRESKHFDFCFLFLDLFFSLSPSFSLQIQW